MTRESIPGQLAVTMDLPKALHGITFNHHAMIGVTHDSEQVRIEIQGSAKSVDIKMDYGTLATIIRLLAVTLEGGAAPNVNQRHALQEAIDRLGTAIAATDEP